MVHQFQLILGLHHVAVCALAQASHHHLSADHAFLIRRVEALLRVATDTITVGSEAA